MKRTLNNLTRTVPIDYDRLAISIRTFSGKYKVLEVGAKSKNRGRVKVASRDVSS